MGRARRSAGFELPGLRVSLVWAPGLAVEGRLAATGPAEGAVVRAPRWRRQGRGRLVAAPVDPRDRVLGLTLMAPGSAAGDDVRPADVFRPFILVDVVRFCLGRCDTPGAPCPAKHDFGLARRLADLGAALGIELSDLLILGARSAYHSLREYGHAIAARRDEAHERAIRADPTLARHVARVRVARDRRRPASSLSRADSLRAALWTCRKCHRRQTRRAPVCRYCGAARTVH